MFFIGGIYALKVDVVKTRAFYEAYRARLCPCEACRRFVSAAGELSPDAAALFARFGVNVRKPARLYRIGKIGGEEQCAYEAEYPVIGRILRDGGPEAKLSVEATYVTFADAAVFFVRRSPPEIAHLPSFVMRATLWLPWIVNGAARRAAK